MVVYDFPENRDKEETAMDFSLAPEQALLQSEARKLSRDQMLDACGACHARRGELTGDFQPGEAFFDHFTLSIPDESSQSNIA